MKHDCPYIRNKSCILEGSVVVSLEKDYELELGPMPGKITQIVIEVQYLCLLENKLESVAWFSLLNKGNLVAYHKYVQVGCMSREAKNYLELILAAHQIVVNWSRVSLDWNLREIF